LPHNFSYAGCELTVGYGVDPLLNFQPPPRVFFIFSPQEVLSTVYVNGASSSSAASLDSRYYYIWDMDYLVYQRPHN